MVRTHVDEGLVRLFPLLLAGLLAAQATPVHAITIGVLGTTFSGQITLDSSLAELSQLESNGTCTANDDAGCLEYSMAVSGSYSFEFAGASGSEPVVRSVESASAAVFGDFDFEGGIRFADFGVIFGTFEPFRQVHACLAGLSPCEFRIVGDFFPQGSRSGRVVGVAVIPEPGAWAVFAIGLLVVRLLRRGRLAL
jgi:hypothetical protein